MNYHIVQFDKTMLNFLPHRQQPFDIIGRLIPKFNGVKWNIEEELHSQKKEKNENNYILKTK